MKRDAALIEQGVSLILQGLGVDVNDHNFTDTPKRVAKAYLEMFTLPKTKWSHFMEGFSDLIIMRGIQFNSMCPHHLLPVHLRAVIGYYPKGQVVGASKLIRICHSANNQPQTQEALTARIADHLDTLVGDNSGIAVVLSGAHDCMSCRGVQQNESRMITSHFSGNFKTNTNLQIQILGLL